MIYRQTDLLGRAGMDIQSCPEQVSNSNIWSCLEHY